MVEEGKWNLSRLVGLANVKIFRLRNPWGLSCFMRMPMANSVASLAAVRGWDFGRWPSDWVSCVALRIPISLSWS